jgi:hypothetical protein
LSASDVIIAVGEIAVSGVTVHPACSGTGPELGYAHVPKAGRAVPSDGVAGHASVAAPSDVLYCSSCV